MLGLLLVTYLASVPLNAQDPPAEPPTLKLAPGLSFVAFLVIDNRIYLVLSQLTPKGTNYLLINPDGECVLVLFEPLNKV